MISITALVIRKSMWIGEVRNHLQFAIADECEKIKDISGRKVEESACIGYQPVPKLIVSQQSIIQI